MDTCMTPVVGVKEPPPQDVLCGRGCSKHVGNVAFRIVVRRRRAQYTSSNVLDKTGLVRTVTDALSRIPCRFLERKGPGELWRPISRQKALEKTRKCLQEARRDGKPEPTAGGATPQLMELVDKFEGAISEQIAAGNAVGNVISDPPPSANVAAQALMANTQALMTNIAIKQEHTTLDSKKNPLDFVNQKPLKGTKTVPKAPPKWLTSMMSPKSTESLATRTFPQADMTEAAGKTDKLEIIPLTTLGRRQSLSDFFQNIPTTLANFGQTTSNTAAKMASSPAKAGKRNLMAKIEQGQGPGALSWPPCTLQQRIHSGSSSAPTTHKRHFDDSSSEVGDFPKRVRHDPYHPTITNDTSRAKREEPLPPPGLRAAVSSSLTSFLRAISGLASAESISAGEIIEEQKCEKKQLGHPNKCRGSSICSMQSFGALMSDEDLAALMEDSIADLEKDALANSREEVQGGGRKRRRTSGVGIFWGQKMTDMPHPPPVSKSSTLPCSEDGASSPEGHEPPAPTPLVERRSSLLGLLFGASSTSISPPKYSSATSITSSVLRRGSSVFGVSGLFGHMLDEDEGEHEDELETGSLL